MHDENMTELRANARRIASYLAEKKTTRKELFRLARKRRNLTPWLNDQEAKAGMPLMSERAKALVSTGGDDVTARGWSDLLVYQILADLRARGWRPAKA